MNPGGEGSDILLCAMMVVRREIDFGRSSKRNTLLVHTLPIISGDSYSMGCVDAQIDTYVK